MLGARKTHCWRKTSMQFVTSHVAERNKCGEKRALLKLDKNIFFFTVFAKHWVGGRGVANTINTLCLFKHLVVAAWCCGDFFFQQRHKIWSVYEEMEEVILRAILEKTLVTTCKRMESEVEIQLPAINLQLTTKSISIYYSDPVQVQT